MAGMRYARCWCCDARMCKYGFVVAVLFHKSEREKRKINCVLLHCDKMKTGIGTSW